MAVIFDPAEFPAHMARDVTLANRLPSEAHNFVEIDRIFEAMDWCMLYKRARIDEIVWLWEFVPWQSNKGMWRHA